MWPPVGDGTTLWRSGGVGHTSGGEHLPASLSSKRVLEGPTVQTGLHKIII